MARELNKELLKDYRKATGNEQPPKNMDLHGAVKIAERYRALKREGNQAKIEDFKAKLRNGR